MKIACPIFKYYAHCQIIVITFYQVVYNERKVLLKNTTIGVLTSPKQPFAMLAYRSLWNNRLCIGLSWMKRIWQPNVRERVIKRFNRLWKNRKGDL